MRRSVLLGRFVRHSEGRRIARYGTQVMAGYSFISEHATGPRVLFQPDRTSGVITLDMSLWTIEPEGSPCVKIFDHKVDVERHGAWDKENLRYADGEKSHPCGYNCSVGVP